MMFGITRDQCSENTSPRQKMSAPFSTAGLQNSILNTGGPAHSLSPFSGFLLLVLFVNQNEFAVEYVMNCSK